ncbi:hypothetical protein [Spirillospora sp. CA-128828]|uniref:hypothetical protein n=1 Tax=Spirillospora sp. CA-128828 TaxID=3240033 RepID=UPI003D8C4B49
MGDVAPSEPPSQAAAALAAERSLGNWLFTVEAKKGFGLKKWRDSRLYMHHNGAVITGRDGYMASYEWHNARILQNLRTVNGMNADARYTLIDPNGAALSIGFGSWAFIGRQKARSSTRTTGDSTSRPASGTSSSRRFWRASNAARRSTSASTGPTNRV